MCKALPRPHPSSSSYLVFSSLDAAGEAFGEELPICLEAFSKNLVLDATYDGGVSSFGGLLRSREGGSGGRVGGLQMELFSEKDRLFRPCASPVVPLSCVLFWKD